MLQVVAARTGYPEEMLGLAMDLEADLGVDSIKRVEILSAVMEQAPQLPEVNTAKMAAMRSLGEIVAYLAQEGGLASSGTNPRSQGQNLNGAVEGVPRPLAEGPGFTALGRYALHALAAPASGLGTRGVLDGKVIVTQDDDGIAFALALRLRARGATVTVVAAAEVPGDADVLVSLAGLRAFSTQEQAASINADVFKAARAVATRFTEHGGTFVTIQDTGGDFGLSGSARAWVAGPAALARTAALEWPRSTVRSIDLQIADRDANQVADAIASELLAGGLECEVGLRADGTRLRAALMPAPLDMTAAGAVDTTHTSFVIATGGGRGVTAACVQSLALAAPGRFLLLGRTALVDEPQCCADASSDADIKRALLTAARDAGQTPKPADLGRQTATIRAVREIKATMEHLRAGGSEAHYVAVDATNAQAMTRVVAIQRALWGPVSGVIHGAGVLADKLIADKSDEQFALVTTTKVVGLHALLAATANDPLKFLLLFSSVAARSGNLGQCDYAMANEILNKVALDEQHRRGPDCVVRSLGWGPWDGGMVDDGLRARFAAMGVDLIPVSAGAQALCNEIAFGPATATEVVVGALNDAHGSRGLAPADTDRECTGEIHINHETHPYLDGHRIKGVPVVPVALVIDWFARAAHALRPDLVVACIRNVRVLRGVRLFNFDQGATERVIVKARQLANGAKATLALELVSQEGARLYAATCDMDQHAPRSTHLPVALKGLQPAARPVYGHAPLFHGPSFQMIETCKGFASTGISATLNGVLALSWHEAGTQRPWQTDPAAVDAAFQLALLWTHHKLSGVSLPTGLESLVLHRTGPWIGRVHATLHARPDSHSKERCVVDVTFANEIGEVLGEALGVETHVIATSEAAVPKTPTLTVV